MWSWSVLIMVTVRAADDLNSEVLTKYTDVFLPGLNGKPAFGSASATCWARGGVCTDIRNCVTLKFETDVNGCTRGFKVCCKVHQFTSPTVGVWRKSGEILVFSPNLQELNQDEVRQLALLNAKLLKNL